MAKKRGYGQDLDNGVLGSTRGIGRDTDPNIEDRGYGKGGICFHSLVGRGENEMGFRSVVPDTAFGNNCISGPGRDNDHNLYESDTPKNSSGNRWSNGRKK